MARSLKVYGLTTIVNSEIVAALGDRPHIRQVRVVVAARTKTEACRLIGVPLAEMNNYGCETGNALEIETAMAAPGQPFAMTVNGRKEKLLKVGVTMDARHSLKLGQTSDLDFAVAIAAADKADDARWAAEKAERQAQADAARDRHAETDRVIDEALARLRPVLAELGIHPDTVAAGSAPGRKGILLPAEAAEYLVRLATNPLEMIA